MVWDWLRRLWHGSPRPGEEREVIVLAARELKLPILDGHPIQHLQINVADMRAGGHAPGYLKLEGDTLTITVWDTCLLTPLQREVGFAVTYELKKNIAREVGANLAEELMRRPN